MRKVLARPIPEGPTATQIFVCFIPKHAPAADSSVIDSCRQTAEQSLSDTTQYLHRNPQVYWPPSSQTQPKYIVHPPIPHSHRHRRSFQRNEQKWNIIFRIKPLECNKWTLSRLPTPPKLLRSFPSRVLLYALYPPQYPGSSVIF